MCWADLYGWFNAPWFGEPWFGGPIQPAWILATEPGPMWWYPYGYGWCSVPWCGAPWCGGPLQLSTFGGSTEPTSQWVPGNGTGALDNNGNPLPIDTPTPMS